MAMHPPHPSNAKSAHFPMTQCCFKLYAVCLVWMRRAFAVYARVVYLFIYFILLPVCKLARVPPVAWQRAWQWALLTLRPRPRTARALKIDPGRLTLIENKKNARAERRSRGSTGKMSMLDVGTMRYEIITVQAQMRYRLSESAGEPKMSYLWLI